MTTYTDAEVDAVALAIRNAKLRACGIAPDSTLAGFALADDYRDYARAALAARDALFETVGERWEVRRPDGSPSFDSEDRDKALMARDRSEERGYATSFVHVTTKRRKR